MNSHSVSVVIPTYNRERWIERSVRTVLAAIEPGDEVIVVDDGSTDGTAAILAKFSDSVRVVNGPHRGCGAARNAGIAAARNPLLAFNDSDDEWHADSLRLRREFMRARPDVLFCFTDFGVRHDDGRAETHAGLIGWHKDDRSWDEILGPGIAYSSMLPLPDGRKDFRVHVGDLYRPIIRGNYVAAQTALVWRARAGQALHFSEDLKIHEDHECFSRLARVGPAAYFDCETFWQWGHDGPRVSAANELRWSGDRIVMLERVWGMDADYLGRHRDVYETMLSVERAKYARALLRAGRVGEARRQLSLSRHAPLLIRAAAALPPFVVRFAHGLRDMVRLSALIAATSEVAGASLDGPLEWALA